MKFEDISVLYFCQRFCLAVVVYAMQLSLKLKPHFANRKIVICTKRSEINHWGTWHLRAFLPFCSVLIDCLFAEKRRQGEKFSHAFIFISTLWLTRGISENFRWVLNCKKKEKA